jgi:RNA polymerase sigma factor (sigma-70 family)
MEESNLTQHGVETAARAPDTAILLTRFISDYAASLMSILSGYIRKAELVSETYEEVQEAALELLDEVYIEAVKTCDHFDVMRSPRAWLLGIASKLVLRKRTEMLERRQYETSFSDLQQGGGDQPPDENPLDHIMALTGAGPEQQVEASVEFEHWLSLVSEGDRHILRLSIIQDLDGEALAEALGCSYKTALVRLFRAKKRLRIAIEKQRGESNG